MTPRPEHRLALITGNGPPHHIIPLSEYTIHILCMSSSSPFINCGLQPLNCHRECVYVSIRKCFATNQEGPSDNYYYNYIKSESMQISSRVEYAPAIIIIKTLISGCIIKRPPHPSIPPSLLSHCCPLQLLWIIVAIW